MKHDDWYNKIIESTVLPFGDTLYGTRYIASLKKWRRIQTMSKEGIQGLEKEKLLRLLKHAVTNIPFYKDQKRSGKLYLKDFPIITKPLIRKNIASFLWHPENVNGLVCEKSSGSSGVQGQVYMSRSEQSNIQAIQTLLWEWSGYRLGSPMLQTGMTLNRGIVKSVKDKVLRTNYQSAFGLDKNDVLNTLKVLRKKPTSFFGGYASSLFVYAEVAADYGINDIRFKSVISWGDKMFSHYRNLIENQFHTKVFDTYGATEGFMIAGQKDGNYYHLMSPHTHLEILD
jgi:phenylacetate-CoA ligase